MNNFSQKYFNRNRNRNNTKPHCSSPYYHNKSIYDCYISKGVYTSRKDIMSSFPNGKSRGNTTNNFIDSNHNSSLTFILADNSFKNNDSRNYIDYDPSFKADFATFSIN